MHPIEAQALSPEFLACWNAAGQHIQSCAEGLDLVWLNARPEPPFLEHLSFRIGNQLFFVRIEDHADELASPGSRDGVRAVAEGCTGHACLLAMKQSAGAWLPVQPDWGLAALDTEQPVSPPDLVTDELIEMTDWELHDFAVDIVRSSIEKSGREIMSSQGNPTVDPSLWFIGDDGPEWVVVRATRYPDREARPPSDWSGIRESCSRLSELGHFASVAVASAEDSFDSASPESAAPLWRGRGMYVVFEGLVPGPSV